MEMNEVIEIALPIILAFMSLLAFQLGSFVRNRVHVIIPLKDPITLMLFIAAFSPAILSTMGYIEFDASNIWYIAFLIAFILSYSLSYIKGEFDMIYVNVHTIVSAEYPNGIQEIDPIVFYYGNDDGMLYLQEQSFKEILKTVILGLRSPLDFPMGQIQRQRSLKINKLFLPEIKLDAVDVVMKEVNEEIVTKFRFFKFKVRSYKFTPSPSCVDSSTSYLVSAWNLKNQQSQIARLESQVFETKVTAQSQFYAGAGDLLIELINDRTPGSDVYQEIAREIDPGPQRTAPIQQIETEKRRKPLFRRRNKKTEPEEDFKIEEEVDDE